MAHEQSGGGFLQGLLKLGGTFGGPFFGPAAEFGLGQLQDRDARKLEDERLKRIDTILGSIAGPEGARINKRAAQTANVRGISGGQAAAFQTTQVAQFLRSLAALRAQLGDQAFSDMLQGLQGRREGGRQRRAEGGEKSMEGIAGILDLFFPGGVGALGG